MGQGSGKNHERFGQGSGKEPGNLRGTFGVKFTEVFREVLPWLREGSRKVQARFQRTPANVQASLREGSRIVLGPLTQCSRNDRPRFREGPSKAQAISMKFQARPRQGSGKFQARVGQGSGKVQRVSAKDRCSEAITQRPRRKLGATPLESKHCHDVKPQRANQIPELRLTAQSPEPRSKMENTKARRKARRQEPSHRSRGPTRHS